MMSRNTRRLECSLQCLLSGSNATGISSLVSIEEVSITSKERRDVAKVLLNAGDSTQRFCIENKIKLARVTCIVLSSLAPCNISGLIGVLLCLSDVGCGAVTIIAPPGAAGIVHNLGPFVNKKYPVIKVCEVGLGGLQDPIKESFDHYDVIAVPVFAVGSSAAIGVAAAILSPATEFHCGILPVTGSFKMAPSIHELIDWTSSLSCRIVSVVPLVAEPKGLSAATCAVFRGLCRASRIFGILTTNNTIVDVCEVEQPQLSICMHSLLLPAAFPRPMPGLLSTLVDKKFSSQWRVTELIKDKLPPVIFEERSTVLLDCGVTVDSHQCTALSIVPVEDSSCAVKIKLSYQKKSSLDMGNCSGNSHRDVSGFSVASMNNIASKIAHQCAALSDTFVMNEEELGNFTLDIDDDESNAKKTCKSPVQTICMCEFSENPDDRTSKVGFCPHCIYSTGYYDAGGVCGRECLCPPDPRDPIVVFLGTGCATPSRHRSNSAILVKGIHELCYSPAQGVEPLLRMDWSLLMDAGESVCCQLFHHCGCALSKYQSLLRSIRIVWISHHHADHHAGLLLLLSEIWRAHMLQAHDPDYQHEWNALHNDPTMNSSRKRVQVIAPSDVIQYTEYGVIISAVEDIVEFIDITETNIFRKKKGATPFQTWSRGPLVCDLQSVPVEHCRCSYGLVMNINRPRNIIGIGHSFLAAGPVKITFSGDCRPSESLVKAGMGSALLIHEATFDNDMQEDAVNKRHSTTDEGLDVARRMGAQHVILTHFSQRYPKVIVQNTTTTDDRMPYTNAVDFMHVAVPSQLPMLPRAINKLASIVFQGAVQSALPDATATA